MDFDATLKQELAGLKHRDLPLQQGLTQSSYVSSDVISPVIISSSESSDAQGNRLIVAKAGIFYTGIIAGCSCSDDPGPLDTQNEYCEITITIDMSNAEATFKLIN